MKYTIESIEGRIFTYKGKGNYLVDPTHRFSLPEGSTRTTWTLQSVLDGIEKGEWVEIGQSAAVEPETYDIY